MNWSKIGMLMNMSLNPKVTKDLVKVYNILKEDKNFTLNKYIKMMLNILKGEKIVKFENKYVLSSFLPPFPSEAFITNVTASLSPHNIFTQQIYAKRSAPISIYLCLTHKCPNNCLYCSAKNRKIAEELTTTEWIKVINDLQDMGTSIIGLTGGEPMVREDIYEIINAIDERSTAILFTSGVNLTLEKAKRLKQSGLFSIGISLDSFDRNKHNANRNSDKAFDYALAALDNSRKAGLYTMVQTVVMKEDVDQDKLFQFFKFAGDKGAHEVKILEPILSGSLLTTEDIEDILYDPKTRQKLIEIQHKANEISGFPKITSFAYTESEEKYGCGAGTQHSYVSGDGHLYPCDFVPMNFGSVRDRGINHLWKEMNEQIGIPKIGCFAQKANRKVYNLAEGKLPLEKEKSLSICQDHKSEKYPKYYRDLQ
ncbi:Radical SAM superfamily enzyme, MoaA/NifB/PqqE/SkfB family [Desulfonispora thiosulfatigenes DSM 11270]|uniref:Radical SAM superfamily enzyme, MoaA/NifB/PqqE/SkfB family n=1 Tax=Desulfonispora thiosulfatigenes DSM 11270 TaxID=656914 RepID=A0A1W1UEK8_DESTI|nr:radical SAM protein [Desulfonispora thiosulfatigenes]SMB79463.1 Radical SAM superfamily enzyme, MoaA/NifB/PqqE/SkfB family [Desulfonispora thiosulfatigenes DSM 11270]